MNTTETLQSLIMYQTDLLDTWKTPAVYRLILCSIIIIFSSVACIITFRRLLLYLLQEVWKIQTTNVDLHFDQHFYSCLFLTLLGWVILIYIDTQEPEFFPVKFGYKEIISLEIFMSCAIFIYEKCQEDGDIDLVKSQSVQKSIGAAWAYGAFHAYFEVSFEDWNNKVRDYAASGKQLSSNSLIIVCPLSCNVRGKLSDKSESISEEGFLDQTEYDQGANINRKYKYPVYKVQDQEHAIYICAQYPSSCGTLWETKDVMRKEIWLYHRDCFIQTLKELLKPYPCDILEYDDVSSNEPLDSFLLRKFAKKES